MFYSFAALLRFYGLLGALVQGPLQVTGNMCET